MLRDIKKRGFGIYLHTPYCVHKCSYCDFYSFTEYTSEDFHLFVQAIKKEIASSVAWLKSQRKELPIVTSIFFGGGTPSLLPGRLIRQMLLFLEKEFVFDPNIEITLEANPETVTREFCSELLLTKVNRVSLGAQSFQQKHLDALERKATPEKIAQATELLWEFGFRNYSLDLIFGIPGQTMEEVVSDIKSAIECAPKHLSAYNLTLKPAHKLFKALPSGDAVAPLYEGVVQALRKAGYGQYEISNYAKPGFECHHNLLYWQGGEFLGLGPSASSRFFIDGNFVHRKQLSDAKLYMKQPVLDPAKLEVNSSKQTVLEAVFLELRCNEGVHLETFESRYGYAIQKAGKYPLYLKEKLLEEEKGVVRLTERGRLLADLVTESLVD